MTPTTDTALPPGHRVRRSPTNLPDLIQSFAGYAVTDSHEEAKYVHDLMRYEAGLKKTQASAPDMPIPTLSALRRQAKTLYAMAVAS